MQNANTFFFVSCIYIFYFVFAKPQNINKIKKVNSSNVNLGYKNIDMANRDPHGLAESLWSNMVNVLTSMHSLWIVGEHGVGKILTTSLILSKTSIRGYPSILGKYGLRSNVDIMLWREQFFDKCFCQLILYTVTSTKLCFHPLKKRTNNKNQITST